MQLQRAKFGRFSQLPNALPLQTLKRHECRAPLAATSPRRGSHAERGSAVVLMVALMAILLILVASNVRALWLLKQELRLVERKQIHRLQAEAGHTNVVSRAAAEPAQPVSRTDGR